MVKVWVPAALRRFTNGEKEILVEGTNIREVIDAVEELHEGFKKRICEENGEIKKAVNIYLNGENIRFMQGADTETNDGDEVSIVPALPGG